MQGRCSLSVASWLDDEELGLFDHRSHLTSVLIRLPAHLMSRLDQHFLRLIFPHFLQSLVHGHELFTQMQALLVERSTADLLHLSDLKVSTNLS